MKVKKRILVLIFFVTSFLGFIMETFIASVKNHQYVKVGALDLPFCIIYGFVIIINYFILLAFHNYLLQLKEKMVERKILYLIVNYIVHFVIFFLVVLIIEFTTAVVLDKIFNHRLWDYRPMNDDLYGYVSLTVLLLFAFGGTCYFFLLFPLLVKISNKLNAKKILIIDAILLMLLVIDIFILLIQHIIS